MSVLGDFERAEEAAQEAFAIAVERWPREGTPDRPGAWLLTTARRRAIDRIRRDRTLATKIPLLEPPESMDNSPSNPTIKDERLELIFMCCHPALAPEAQVALTLRALGGLTTDEIARAFLVPVETMKRRLSRAKSKVKEAGIPFRVPVDDLLPDRLAAVLAVVYLIFNEGYGGRFDLAAEAIRLGRILVELMPAEPEAQGLLALMLCHHARRAARFSQGEIVLLEDQDRSLWDSKEIAEGRAVLAKALESDRNGPYVLQAVIASLQTESQIDWVRIAAIYAQLAELTHSPVITLNCAVATAQAGSPDAALVMIEQLDLGRYPYFHSTRAELLLRLGRREEARLAFDRALELTHRDAERRFLQRRLSEL